MLELVKSLRRSDGVFASLHRTPQSQKQSCDSYTTVGHLISRIAENHHHGHITLCSRSVCSPLEWCRGSNFMTHPQHSETPKGVALLVVNNQNHSKPNNGRGEFFGSLDRRVEFHVVPTCASKWSVGGLLPRHAVTVSSPVRWERLCMVQVARLIATQCAVKTVGQLRECEVGTACGCAHMNDNVVSYATLKANFW